MTFRVLARRDGVARRDLPVRPVAAACDPRPGAIVQVPDSRPTRRRGLAATTLVASVAVFGIALVGVVAAQEPGGGIPPAAVCTHTGTEFKPPVVMVSGGAQCPAVKFDLTIGVNGVGTSFSIRYDGCPSLLIIAPGRYAKVPKAHYKAVNPVDVPWVKITYEADCGGMFGSPTCKAASTELLTDKNSQSWEEEGCDLLR